MSDALGNIPERFRQGHYAELAVTELLISSRELNNSVTTTLGQFGAEQIQSSNRGVLRESTNLVQQVRMLKQ